MRISKPIGFAIGVAASIAVLAGCSGSNTSSVAPLNSQLPGGGQRQSVVRNHVPTVLPGAMLKMFHPTAVPNTGKSWASPNSTRALVYACGYYASVCNWYRHLSNHQAGVITGLSNPQGVGVDKASNVYIANTGLTNIPVYPKGSTTPSTTLDDSGWYPVDVAVDSRGTVFAANIFDTSFNPGNVSVYAPGATSPTRFLNDPNFYQVISVAVDENGTVIVCYNNINGVGSCDAFFHEKEPGVNIVTGFGFAGGVAFDRAESFVFDDQLGPTTNTWETDDNGVTYTHCNTITQSGDPLFLNFNPAGDRLFVANASNGNVTEQKFRDCTGTGHIVFTYSDGWSSSNPPFGVVESPGEVP